MPELLIIIWGVVIVWGIRAAVKGRQFETPKVVSKKRGVPVLPSDTRQANGEAELEYDRWYASDSRLLKAGLSAGIPANRLNDFAVRFLSYRGDVFLSSEADQVVIKAKQFATEWIAEGMK